MTTALDAAAAAAAAASIGAEKGEDLFMALQCAFLQWINAQASQPGAAKKMTLLSAFAQ